MRTLLTVLAAVTLSATLTAQSSSIAVYVTTQASRDGFTDPDLKQRTDSVADLRKALSKKSGIVLVDEPTAAAVQLDVLSRGYLGNGTLSSTTTRNPLTGQAQTSSTENKEATLSATLRVGTYETKLEGKDQLLWSQAAQRLAEKVEKWISQNRERLTK